MSDDEESSSGSTSDHHPDGKEVALHDEDRPNPAHGSSVKLALEQLRAHQTLGKKPIEETQSSKKRQRVESESSGRHVVVTDFAEGTIEEQFSELGLSTKLSKALMKQFRIKGLFILQEFALKAIIANPRRDVCVSAPTGSGKTLMYLLPMIHSLQDRVVTRLRALVLVPSRELTNQVFEVARVLCNAANLKCEELNGAASLREEARRIVSIVKSNDRTKYSSTIDVLISTPGRLMDHIERTEGFTLEHLELLVIDEADKLLSQSYQDWLDRVYKAATRSVPPETVEFNEQRVSIPNQATIRDAPGTKVCVHSFMSQKGPRLRRILCSATLTNNPQKIAALALHQPILIDSRGVEQTFIGAEEQETSRQLSANLAEQIYRVSTKNKPLVLLAVLNKLLKPDSKERALIFASSVERAQRVYSLLVHGFAESIQCALLSSQQSQHDRSEALRRFQAGKTRILVSTDLGARGIDVPGLEFVVSYDAPKKTTTHVHRAGRTARAGQKGTSIVLLQREDVKGFQEIQEKLNLQPIIPSELDQATWESFRPVLAAWRETVANVSALESNKGSAQ